MQSKNWQSILVLGMAIVLGSACSSSKSKTEDSMDVIPASSDAGTDAIPLENPETIAPVQDPAQSPAIESSQAPAPETSEPAAVAPAPISESVGPTTEGSYTVQKGDTLMKIAYETYGNVYRWKAIYEANRDKISDPNRVPSGVVLKIDKPNEPVNVERNGERYEIRRGDTLGKISNNVYGTPGKWKKLWENNRQLIRDPNKIFAGFSLYYVADGSMQQPQQQYQPQEQAPSADPSVGSAPASLQPPVEAPVEVPAAQ